MDEIKAITKSVSELKTIQNRLKKVLKDRDWALSFEIPRLEAIIEETKKANDVLSIDLQKVKLDLESKEKLLAETKSMLDESKKENHKYETENDSLRTEIKGLKSDYLYRSLAAKNQFLEDKLNQQKSKFEIQTRAALGNYKKFEDIKTQYRASLGIEIDRLEKRNKELEKLNDELLKENVKLRKE